MRAKSKVYVKVEGRVIRNAKEAMHYCIFECPKRGSLGCAFDCKVRKRFKIPPHGDKYP